MSSEPVPPSAELRASDADRERAVEILSRAVADGRLGVDELDERLESAYALRTRRDLDLLIGDVTADSGLDGPLAGAAAPGDGVTVREGSGGTGWVVSILGGHDRRGHWRIARRATVVNVLGGSDIDLRDVELSCPETQLNVYSLMGGCEVRVPTGVRVEVSKFALMGGNDVDLGEVQPPPGAPVIRVRVVTVMGGVTVRRASRLSRAERRALEKGERRDR